MSLNQTKKFIPSQANKSAPKQSQNSYRASLDAVKKLLSPAQTPRSLLQNQITQLQEKLTKNEQEHNESISYFQLQNQECEEKNIELYELLSEQSEEMEKCQKALQKMKILCDTLQKSNEKFKGQIFEINSEKKGLESELKDVEDMVRQGFDCQFRTIIKDQENKHKKQMEYVKICESRLQKVQDLFKQDFVKKEASQKQQSLLKNELQIQKQKNAKDQEENKILIEENISLKKNLIEIKEVCETQNMSINSLRHELNQSQKESQKFQYLYQEKQQKQGITESSVDTKESLSFQQNIQKKDEQIYHLKKKLQQYETDLTTFSQQMQGINSEYEKIDKYYSKNAQDLEIEIHNLQEQKNKLESTQSQNKDKYIQQINILKENLFQNQAYSELFQVTLSMNKSLSKNLTHVNQSQISQENEQLKVKCEQLLKKLGSFENLKTHQLSLNTLNNSVQKLIQPDDPRQKELRLLQQENSAYKLKFQLQENLIFELKETINEFNSKKGEKKLDNNLLIYIEKLQEENSKLQNILTLMDQKLLSLSSYQNDQDQQILILQQNKMDLSSLNQAYSEKIENLLQTYHNILEESMHIQEEQTQINSQYRNLKSENIDLEKQKVTLEFQQIELEKQMKQFENEREILKGRIKDLEQNLQEKQLCLGYKDNQLEIILHNYQQLEKKISSYSGLRQSRINSQQ